MAPPAVVIVVRHGARLDAANRDWHLSAQDPYDPPITWGGWNQSRALGARIASILDARLESPKSNKSVPTVPSASQFPFKSSSESGGQARDDGEDSLSPGSTSNLATPRVASPLSTTVSTPDEPRTPMPFKKRRQRIFVHSSPFQRCVQTSIGLVAGLGQYSSQMRVSPRSSVVFDEDDETEYAERGRAQGVTTGTPRIKLRIDAFLGEWLSPDYYEKIKPPPPSRVMVAMAKTELRRLAEPLPAASFSREESSSPTTGHFPGGWGSGSSGRRTSTDLEKSIEDLRISVFDGLSRDRTSSIDSINSTSSNSRDPALLRTMASQLGGYTPPNPRYTMSNNDPIPPGFVAHARDHCVEIDHHWDSMLTPQEWGDGGVYGEEWSSMHKRFRKGLNRMVTWYEDHTPCSDPQNTSKGTPLWDPEVDETVLILVTHGAGANAIIGALSNQPVLMDIGLASLTLAERIDTEELELEHANDPDHEHILPKEYKIQITASTDHLSHALPTVTLLGNAGRSGSAPGIQNGSRAVVASALRRSVGGSSSPLAQPASNVTSQPFVPFELPISLPKYSAMHRSASTSRSSAGLWSKPSKDETLSAGNEAGSALVAKRAIETKSRAEFVSPGAPTSHDPPPRLTSDDRRNTDSDIPNFSNLDSPNDVPAGRSPLQNSVDPPTIGSVTSQLSKWDESAISPSPDPEAQGLAFKPPPSLDTKHTTAKQFDPEQTPTQTTYEPTKRSTPLSPTKSKSRHVAFDEPPSPRSHDRANPVPVPPQATSTSAVEGLWRPAGPPPALWSSGTSTTERSEKGKRRWTVNR